MGCWDPKQCLQVQWLGTREGSSSGQGQLCAHAQLWGLAACACGVAGASCKHTCSDEGRAGNKGQGQLRAHCQLQGGGLAVRVNYYGC